MKLSIKTRKDDKFEIDANSNDSIDNIKTQIFTLKSIPKEQQHLIFDCITLKDEEKLTNYSIQNGSEILLINREEALLLKSSKIFVGSTLIDHIRQSYIDLELNPDAQDVTNLLIEAISYLDEKLDINTTKEIFFLILSCFSQYPEESFKIYQTRYQKPNISSIHIIILTSMASFIVCNNLKISISSYSEFLSSSMSEVLSQFEKNSIIKVKGFEIIPEFRMIFIANLILANKLTEKIVISFSPYFFSKETDLSILNMFIQKVHSDHLLKFIPESLFIDNNLFLQLSYENIANFLSIISEQNFQKVLPLLINLIENKGSSLANLSNTVVNKCIELNVNSKSISSLLLNYNNYKELPIWEYMNKNGLTLTEKTANRIQNSGTDSFAQTPLVIKLAEHPEKLPKEILSYSLQNNNDINVYEKIFRTKKIECDILATIDFWKHVLSLINKVPVSSASFTHYFQKNVKENEIFGVFDQLIFDQSLPNQNQSKFLNSLLRSLPKKYNTAYHSHDAEFAAKLIDRKEIPSPSLLKLFNMNSIELKPQNTPRLLYIYAISEAIVDIKSIEIMKFEPNETLVKFIEQNNYDLLRDIDEKSLSLVACSLYYANSAVPFGMRTRTNLLGLTIENFLPFLAISLKYRDELNINFIDEKLFSESCNYLNKNPSPLQVASINSILLNDNFISKCRFTRIYSFLYSFINSFIKGEYRADPITFLQAIFKISGIEKAKSFWNNSNLLFNIIIENVPTIINNPRFKNRKLNLDVFNKLYITEKLTNLIDMATSYEQIILTIKFLNSHCDNTPILLFKNLSNINTALQKAVYDENWDEVLLISNFTKSNNIKTNKLNLYGKQIPFKILQSIYDIQKINNIDEMITIFLSIPDLEKNLNLFQSVFLNLMSNYPIAIKLITIYLEKITNQQVLTPQYILEKLAYFILFYKKELIDAISQSYLYSETKKYFIRKMITSSAYKIDNRLPNFDFLVKLIQHNSYQSFICLQNIATHFPFLFEPEQYANENHSLVAVEIVLPTLNCVSQMFNLQETDKNLSDFKRAFAALSFLHTCLYSISFLSTFVLWIFENITKLTESQIYCFSQILISLFRTDTIRKIITAYAVKYKILEIITSLLSREIHNEQFKYHYNQNLYELSLLYLNSMSNVQMKGDAIFIEQIRDNKIKNPFENQFNNFMTINPLNLNPLNFVFKNPSKQINRISTFINDIQNTSAFWIFENENVNQNDIDMFLKSFPKDTAGYKKAEIKNYPQRITNEMHTYLLSCLNWKMNYFENCTSTLQTLVNFPSYYDSINSSLRVLNSFTSSGFRTSVFGNSYRSSINPYEYFKLSLVKETYFNALVKEVSTCDTIKNNETISNLISKISKICDEYFKCFIQLISEYISKKQISPQILGGFCQILEVMCKNKKEIENDFLEICGNKLIDIVLMKQYRSDEFLLNSISSTLKLVKGKLPTKVTHIIGLIFDYHPKLISIAIDLYFKVDNIESVDLMPIIKNRFEKDIAEEIPDFKRIKTCMSNFPTLAKESLQTTKVLLTKAIDYYIIGNYKSSDLQDMILQVLNKAAPDQISFDHKTTTINNEEKSKENLLYPPPEYLKETNRVFWCEFYEENLAFLNEMLKKNKDIARNLHFLFNYPELISFNLRYSIYRTNLNNIRGSGNSVYLRVSRKRLLLDSFGYWCISNPKNFISGIEVSFKEENGSDAGGLTREWITYVVRDLLDPQYGLFIKNENQTYHLNPSFDLSMFNKECLRMAGGIIAISMIKRTNINAHLSTALLKQILHQEIVIDDMKESDELLYNSFRSILDSEDVKPLDLVFAIDDESQNGKIHHINLIENGDHIEVTNENKAEYVKLYANYKLKECVSEQMKAFCDGFESIISHEYVKMFTPKELDMIICGNNNIDIENMKKYVKYEGSYYKDHPVIQMFYNVISKWSQEDLSKLVLFITGSANVGVNGFEDFKNNGNSVKITSYGKSKDHLPIAHTCSNQLVLPEYDNEKDMNDKLLLAIQDCHFGFS